MYPVYQELYSGLLIIWWVDIFIVYNLLCRFNQFLFVINFLVFKKKKKKKNQLNLHKFTASKSTSPPVFKSFLQTAKFDLITIVVFCFCQSRFLTELVSLH
eukprot:TRINITY_DN17263_c0_g3_i1.p4 TRINITY_DN17263_c0_g3~~TRINITY_DN17263_c0_g3_i1.p4  ORF type:complete len:101 (+),score=0.61 TRINITY_DN17263_c0_g3_i1:297-599(+)